MKRLFVILSFISFAIAEGSAQTQEINIEHLIEERLTYVAETNNEDLDFSALTELYWQYIQHPIPLSIHSIAPLKILQLLSYQQFESLKEHLSKYETLLSLYELQIIPHFDLETILRIKPFVTVSPINSNFNIENINQELVYRTSYKSEGSLLPKNQEQFLGSPIKQNLRYRFNSNSLKIGVNTENDAGEAFFKAPNSLGYDFYSGYVAIKDIGIIKELIVGDFQANFGQGLALWTGFGFGKSSNTQLVAKADNSVRPYASSKEYEYLRGIATHINIGNLSFYPLVVFRKVDANVVDTVDGNLVFSSVEGNGLHRTNNELTKKNQSTLTAYGLNTTYRFKKLSLGLTLFQHKYHGDIPNDASLYEAVLPENQHLIQRASFNFLYSGSHGIYFGEIASNQHKNLAGLIGTTQAIGQRVNSTLLFRSYDAGYVGSYTIPFADGVGSNETGLYWGNEISINKKNTVSFYTDLYRSKWISRYMPAISSGKDYLLKWQYTLRKKMTFYLFYRNNTEEKNDVNEEAVFKPLAKVKKQRVQLHVRKQINKAWLFQARVVANRYGQGLLQEQGRLMYQELSYRQQSWTASIRYTNYHTAGYNSRIYTYEKDVLYSFNTPAYFGTGNSVYFLVKKKINSSFQLWIRIARNRTKNDLITEEGEPLYKSTNHVTTQIQWKF
jgi:hypothetical protein